MWVIYSHLTCTFTQIDQVFKHFHTNVLICLMLKTLGHISCSLLVVQTEDHLTVLKSYLVIRVSCSRGADRKLPGLIMWTIWNI